MGRKPLEKVSQREYARRLGVSNTAVSKAIEDGKIVKGFDKATKKIIVEKANEEWGNIHIAAAAEGEQTQADVINHIKHVLDNQTVSKPQSIPQQQQHKKDPSYDGDNPFSELEEFELAVHSKAAFAEALRVEKVAKARQEIIKLREMTNELVNKAEVYRQLFAFGQTVRSAMLVIPDRCIDEILASTNRGISHQVLTKYIHEALTKLSEFEQLEFKRQEN